MSMRCSRSTRGQHLLGDLLAIARDRGGVRIGQRLLVAQRRAGLAARCVAVGEIAIDLLRVLAVRTPIGVALAGDQHSAAELRALVDGYCEQANRERDQRDHEGRHVEQVLDRAGQVAVLGTVRVPAERTSQAELRAPVRADRGLVVRVGILRPGRAGSRRTDARSVSPGSAASGTRARRAKKPSSSPRASGPKLSRNTSSPPSSRRRARRAPAARARGDRVRASRPASRARARGCAPAPSASSPGGTAVPCASDSRTRASRAASSELAPSSSSAARALSGRLCERATRQHARALELAVLAASSAPDSARS